MIMLHTRAVRFVHAFCFDMVVLVFCSSVSCSFCLALVPVSFFWFANCFCFLFVIFSFGPSVFCVALVRVCVTLASSGRLGAQAAGGHLSAVVFCYSCSS